MENWRHLPDVLRIIDAATVLSLNADLLRIPFQRHSQFYDNLLLLRTADVVNIIIITVIANNIFIIINIVVITILIVINIAI